VNLFASCSCVTDCRRVVPSIVAIGEHEHVRVATERIIEKGNRFDVDLGVAALGLLGAAAIVVPDWEV
jgi:calcineurin-like phosphoesterase